MIARMSRQERELLQAQLAEPTYRLWYEEATAEGASLAAERVQAIVHDLFENLIKQGKLSEAADLIGEQIEAHPELEIQAARVVALQAALDRPDEEICECPPRIHQEMRGQGPISFVLSRFVAQDAFYCPERAQFVKVWRCSDCGDLNAHDTYPDAVTMLSQERIQLHARHGASDPANGATLITTEKKEATSILPRFTPNA